MRNSYILAAIIAIAIGAWIYSGQLRDTDESPSQAAAADPADPASDGRGSAQASSGEKAAPFAVRVSQVTAEPHSTSVTIRGRTDAERTVDLRSQASGKIARLPVEKGARVNAGDTICQLAVDARDARIEEAEALVRQRKLELDVNEKLAAKGHRAETQVAAARAAYDASVALLKQTRVDLGHIYIKAPFTGILEERPAELGAYLQPGSLCGTLVDLDPILIIGQVSEDDVERLAVGATGKGRLLTGETVDGRIRYLGSNADPATRTFRVEMEIPNPNYRLRAGITSEILIPGPELMAHRIPSSVLTLNDAGEVGVRLVDAEQRVHFVPVEIVEETPDGVWVAGLPQTAQLITVGQDYVKEGQVVTVRQEDLAGAPS